ncbi:hypothetical protein D3C81_1802480 [compost metagenome]
MMKLQASKAAWRWALAVPTKTMGSPGSSRPIRWRMSTLSKGQRCRASSAIFSRAFSVMPG